jgi:Protein of unknown function (DUF2846)
MGLHRIVVAFYLAIQLAACAGPSALESQSRQRDPRLARMYFLREQGVLGALGGRTAAAEIKVNGKTVGSVINGSYLFVDRPPGLYKLSAQTGLSLAFETEAQVEAGHVYYFGVGVPQSGAPGQGPRESGLCWRWQRATDACSVAADRRILGRCALQP